MSLRGRIVSVCCNLSVIVACSEPFMGMAHDALNITPRDNTSLNPAEPLVSLK